ncbi:PQQ-dependent sugar dehydrogenase [soil metagenome]
MTALLVTSAVLAGVGGGAWALWERGRAPSPSRAAAYRLCARAYVTPPVVPLDDRDSVRLRRVAGVDEPAALAFVPGSPADPPKAAVGVVGQRSGQIRVIRGGEVERQPVLDLSDDTWAEGDAGLLALAYAPDGRWLYVLRTDETGDGVLTAHPVAAGVPEPGSERLILTIDHHLSAQHHGGGLAFGPDGLLYIGTGDGGGLGDPQGNAQSLDSLLGKVLRIRPTPERDDPYAVPPDNPFVGLRAARPEVFAYGLRNPFRLAFDAATGDLWVGDVGQSCWEELNWTAAGQLGGQNYGWDHREGTHAFEGGGPGGFVDPVHSYAHCDGWCSVIAGFFYLGAALGGLDGALLHTDYCRGRVYALRYAPGGGPEIIDLGVRVDAPVALVPGPDGEPWLVSLEGEVFRLEPERGPVPARR